MRYYRVQAGVPTLEQEAGPAGEEADIWPGGRGRPFVLVARRPWQPPTDIYETPTHVVVKMEVAGMSEESLDITIHDDLLTIRGRRVDETNRHKIGYHHMGIPYGEFLADIALPGPIDHDGVRAEYQVGFLVVWLPKLPPRMGGNVRITINP